MPSGSSPGNREVASSSESVAWWRHHDRPFTEGERMVRCLIGLHRFVEWQRTRGEIMRRNSLSPMEARAERLRRCLGECVADAVGHHWEDFAPVVGDLVDAVWGTFEHEYRQRAEEVSRAD